MSGLLQRLAAQASGAPSAQAALRVRSAMSMHAQVPARTVREERETTTAPRRVVDPPRLKDTDSQGGEHHVRTEQSLALERIEKPPPSTESHEITRTAPFATGVRERISQESAARLPESLLKEVTVAIAAPSIVPLAPPSVLALQSARYSATEPTEVHVHIGRIEVIAATEPAVPKKSRGKARTTLPLADYLAKRRQS